MRAEFDELADRAGRAERRAGELQSVVDALGRERAAVRSEAGALRARLEQMNVLEDRLKRLTSELEQLRRQNDVLEQELARTKSPRATPPRALSK
jgi:chromosome segregation ATPase